LGDALLGQDLAEPGMLVVHVPFPSFPAAPPASPGDMDEAGLSLASSEWRQAGRPESGTFPTPALARSLSLVDLWSLTP
jgi:hypothetical protein